MNKFKLSSIAVAVALASVPVVHAAEPVVAQPVVAQPVVAGDEPGTFKIPGTDTSVGIYGFIHVDVIKDLNTGTSGAYYDGGSIGIKDDPSGVNGDTRKQKLNVSAQTSRFGIKSSTQTDIGKIRTVLEGDFVDTGTGNKLRLRQAYGEVSSTWGSLLTGQYWTLFRSGEAIPETVDFNGQGGVASARKPQVRYTSTLGPVGSFAVAVEVPANPVANSIVKAPAVTAAWVKSGDWGAVSARAIGNQLAYETIETGNVDSKSKTKYGYGASIGTGFKVTSADLLQALVTSGKGISQYVEDANYNPEYVASNGKIILTSVNAVTAGWQHTWTPKIRTNLSYGHTKLGDQYRDAVGHAANRTVDAGFANLIWTPVKNFEVGVELAHGQRKLSSGQSGKFDRFQTSFHYNF